MSDPAASAPASPAPAPARSARRLLLVSAPALLLVLVALWEMVSVGRARAAAVDEAAWRELTAALRARAKPGELILFAPGWIDPVGRQHVGDLVTPEMAGRMDADRYGVVWEVALGDARAPEVADLSPVTTVSFDRLSLRRYERKAVEVMTDFVAELGAAAVAGRTAGKPEVSLEEVGFAPRRCVRVTPQPDQTATITYRGVALGGELVGYVGLADVFTRRDIREPARLVVSIDGVEVARTEVGVEDGWVRFAAATEPRASAEVTFAASALGRGARDRRVCFAAEARR